MAISLLTDTQTGRGLLAGDTGGDPQSRRYNNGRIPTSALVRTSVGLLADRPVATAFDRMLAAARAQGVRIRPTDGYRDYATQVVTRRNKGRQAARPGTSNHGWGRAFDMGEGVNRFDGAGYRWMAANAARFGFENPRWARQGGSNPEPWHWEYVGTSASPYTPLSGRAVSPSSGSSSASSGMASYETPEVGIPNAPGNGMEAFAKMMFPQGVPAGADIPGMYRTYIGGMAPAATTADALRIAQAGGTPYAEVPVPELPAFTFDPTDTSRVEAAIMSQQEAANAVATQMAERRQSEANRGNKALLARVLGPELFRMFTGGQFQSRLPEEEALVRDLFSKSRQAEDAQIQQARMGAAQAEGQIANLQMNTQVQDRAGRLQVDQLNSRRIMDQYTLNREPVTNLATMLAGLGHEALTGAINQDNQERQLGAQVYQGAAQRGDQVADLMFNTEYDASKTMAGFEQQASINDADNAAAIAAAASKATETSPETRALLDALGQFEGASGLTGTQSTDLAGNLESFFAAGGPWQGDTHSPWLSRGDSPLNEAEQTGFGRIEQSLNALSGYQTNLETESRAVVGKMRAAGVPDATVNGFAATVTRYQEALRTLPPPKGSEEGERAYGRRVRAWYNDGGRENLQRISTLQAAMGTAVRGAPTPGAPAPGGTPAVPAAPGSQGAGSLARVPAAELEGTVQSLRGEAAVNDSLMALLSENPVAPGTSATAAPGRPLTTGQAATRVQRINASLRATGMMLGPDGATLVPIPNRPQTASGLVF